MSADRASIEAEQLRRLNTLLAALVPANRFYAPRIAAAGCGRSFRSLSDFFTRFPFTTKPALVVDQAAHPPYGSNLTFPLDRYSRYSQTSGTAGQPLRWLDTPESWNWMVENWMKVHAAAGVTCSDRIFFAFGFGPFIGFWLAFEAATRIGCLCIPGGGMNSAARLRAILDNQVTILCCTPTYALRLAEVAHEEGIDLKRAPVRTLIVAGEPGGSIPSTRERISRAWNGARVFDHHGMTEVGPVTHEWPDRPGFLAVIESGYIAEVIDPTSGMEVSTGQTGELVLTTLGRIGSPLLRYRTGDLVKKAFIENHLVLEGGILGRADDMVIVRGVNIHPTAVEEIVRRFPEIITYRVEVRRAGSLSELAITIEPSADCPDVTQLARKLESALTDSFLLRFPVSSVAPGTLPRFEMKAKRWVVL
jgi:phenylacetate-CoA ligase